MYAVVRMVSVSGVIYLGTARRGCTLKTNSLARITIFPGLLFSRLRKQPVRPIDLDMIIPLTPKDVIYIEDTPTPVTSSTRP